MKRLKTFGAALATGALALALAACGSGAEEPGAAEEPNATDDAGASGEAVELIMSIGTGQNLKDGAASKDMEISTSGNITGSLDLKKPNGINQRYYYQTVLNLLYCAGRTRGNGMQ